MKHKTNNKKVFQQELNQTEASLKREKFDHRSLSPPCDSIQE